MKWNKDKLLKNKKLLILSGVLTSSIFISSVSAIAIPISMMNGSSSESKKSFRDDKISNVNFLESNENTNNYFQSLNVYDERIVSDNVSRTVNTSIYDTQLMQTWKSKNEFESRNHNGYPAYDFNWKIISDRGNSTFQEFVKKYYNDVNGEKVNGGKYQIGDETIDLKYNDYRFIRNEIANKTFKKHPAADGMHNPDLFIKKETKAISKEFIYMGKKSSVYNTGMYAAPGEIVTLELTKEQFELWKRNNFNGIRILLNHQSFDQPRGYGDSGMTAGAYPYTQVRFDMANFKYGNPSTSITNESDWIVENGIYKFQFGSPFGGSIAIDYAQPLYDNGKMVPLQFKISGGIEEVHYIQGKTTEQEWINQLTKVKNGTITAPYISLDTFWFNASCNMYYKYQFYKSDYSSSNDFPSEPIVAQEKYIPTTNDIVIGGYGVWYGLSGVKTLDQLLYPYDNIKKWDNFLMLSSYFMRQDQINTAYKEIMRFGLEVWGGMAGWGGSYNFWTYPDNFTSMFFSGPDGFKTTSNWLAMHEINHGYEFGNWNFHNLPHGVTNQITAVNMSVLNDTPRYRNLFNSNGEWGNDWSRTITPYTVALDQQIDAYTIFANYLSMVGTSTVLEYGRWQSENAGKNGNLPYGGLNELYIMSLFSKYNFYPIMKDLYGGQNFLKIPMNYNEANESEKKLIDKMNKFPAVDIIGNLYASGIYLYDYEIKDYVYTNDVVPAFEIPAGIDSYVFDFERGIASKRKGFDFRIKKFDSKTTLGGKLSVDPTNPKNLVYIPPKFNNIDEFAKIDEFNLEIEATHSGKYKNYVPGYKFKIKIRQNPFASQVSYKNLVYSVEKENLINATFGSLSDQSQILKSKFIVPKDGIYKFDFKNKSKLKISKNSQSLDPNVEHELKKDEIIDVVYNFNPNERNFTITRKDKTETKEEQTGNEKIDFFSNCVSPYLDFNNLNSSIFNNEKIKYKPRYTPTNGFGWWSKYYIDQPYEKEVWNSIPTDSYDISWKDGDAVGNGDAIKKTHDGDFRIQWGGNTNDITNLNYKFNTPATFSSIAILGGTGVYSPWAPQKIKISGKTSNGQNVELTGGEFISYSSMFKPTYSDARYLNLKEPVKDIVELNIDIFKEQGQHCLQLVYIDFLKEKVDSEINNIIPSNDSFIKYSSGFKTEKNSFDASKNLSLFNGESKTTSNSGETIEFKFRGNGFSIVGKKPIVDTLIDVYVDGKLIGNNVNIKGEKLLFSQTLYSWFDNDASIKEHIVKIVTKSSGAFYFDGFGISTLFNTIGRVIPL